MNLYCLLPDLSHKTDHFVIDNPNKPAHKEVLSTTRILVIEEQKSGSFMLWRYDIKGTFRGDTWHPNLEEAKHQAVFEYGNKSVKWVEIPNDATDTLIYVLRKESMDEKFLEDFYKYAILSEFRIEKNESIVWGKHEEIGPDDSAHYFSIDNKNYVIVFRDYDVFLDVELKELIKTRNGRFHYIETFTGEKKFHFKPLPPEKNKHIGNITGTFVLLEI